MSLVRLAVYSAFSTALLTGCSGSAARAGLTDREIQGLGWCVGLVSGAGEDAAALRAIAEKPENARMSITLRRWMTENEREAARLMSRSGGLRRAKLTTVKNRDCAAFLRRS